MTLRLCALLALILGLLFWVGIVVPTGALLDLHILLGLLVILGLWIVAIAHLKRRPGLAIGAFLLSLTALIFGMSQESLFALAPSLSLVIKIAHVFLVFSAIALSGPLAGGSGNEKTSFPSDSLWTRALRRGRIGKSE
jgi:hypothetical protein